MKKKEIKDGLSVKEWIDWILYDNPYYEGKRLLKPLESRILWAMNKYKEDKDESI
jgi:hypothetical protein